MTKPSAFRGTYSDWRLVKTRAVVQVIFEVPLADADAAYEVLGGMPVHGKERWFGIAAIKSTAEESAAKPHHVTSPDIPNGGAARGKMDWRDMQPAAQCALRCNDATFRAFLMEEHSFRPRSAEDPADEAASFLRHWFQIKSRSELNTDPKRRMLWKQFDDSFSAWKAVENA